MLRANGRALSMTALRKERHQRLHDAASLRIEIEEALKWIGDGGLQHLRQSRDWPASAGRRSQGGWRGRLRQIERCRQGYRRYKTAKARGGQPLGEGISAALIRKPPD